MHTNKKAKLVILESILSEALTNNCLFPDDETIFLHLNSFPYSQLISQNMNRYSLRDIVQIFSDCHKGTPSSQQTELNFLWRFFTDFFSPEEKECLLRELVCTLNHTVFHKGFHLLPKPEWEDNRTDEKIYREKRKNWSKNKTILRRKITGKSSDVSFSYEDWKKFMSEGLLSEEPSYIYIMPNADLKLYTISDIAIAFANAMYTGNAIDLYSSLWRNHQQADTTIFFISADSSLSDRNIYAEITRKKNLHLDNAIYGHFLTFSLKETHKNINKSIYTLLSDEFSQKKETPNTFFLRETLKMLIDAFNKIKIPKNFDTLFQTDCGLNHKKGSFSKSLKNVNKIRKIYTEGHLKETLNSLEIETFIEKYYNATPIVIEKQCKLAFSYSQLDKNTDVATLFAYFPYILYAIITASLSKQDFSSTFLSKMIENKDRYLRFQMQNEKKNSSFQDASDKYQYTNFHRDFHAVFDNSLLFPKTHSEYLRSSICFRTYLFKQCICSCLNVCGSEVSKMHFFESIFLFIYSLSDNSDDLIEYPTLGEDSSGILQANASKLFFYIMKLILDETSLINTLQ